MAATTIPRCRLTVTTPDTVGRTRRYAERALTRWGKADLAEPIRLVLSELATNAVQAMARAAAPGCIRVLMRPEGPDSIRITVSDPVIDDLVKKNPDGFDEGGRGLFLVDAYTGGQWGVQPTPDGKCVWAVVCRPEAAM